ncbi:MAG: HAD hydrolase-like protein [Planctomycetota bacterium]
MLLELTKNATRRWPGSTLRDLRWLAVFREVREELRALGQAQGPLERVQFEEPAARLAVPVEPLEALVREWMWERPLPFLARHVRPGMVSLLRTLRDRGVAMGVYSDYPVTKKLEAMGLAEFFPVQVAATDKDVNAFKPHPRGFEVAAQKLGVAPADVFFIGDRMDVDGLGAMAAGQSYCILGGDPEAACQARDVRELAEVLHVG